MVNAEEILNRDHFGMEKVKERILEFLAVRCFHPEKSKGKSPVICLAGPPGTGKTSIAKSVAEALNKKYVSGMRPRSGDIDGLMWVQCRAGSSWHLKMPA